jgi:hypothetical protein
LPRIDEKPGYGSQRSPMRISGPMLDVRKELVLLAGFELATY